MTPNTVMPTVIPREGKKAFVELADPLWVLSK
jgi:hypothetical protein